MLFSGGSYKENDYPNGHYRVHAYLEKHVQDPQHALTYYRENQYIPDIVEQPLVLDVLQNWSAEEVKSIVVESRWKSELQLHDFEAIIQFLKTNPSTEERHEFITNRSWYDKQSSRSDPNIASWVTEDSCICPDVNVNNNTEGLRRSHRRVTKKP